MNIISSIRLFLLDPCVTGCTGCSLGHKIRDKNKVYSNYLRLIEYLDKTTAIQVSNGANTPLGDELEIALESSDLLTSNSKFLLSSLFQNLVRTTVQSFRHVELANNGALTESNWKYLKILANIVQANKIKIEISTPETTYFNGVEVVNLPENEMNGIFLTPYIRVVGVKLHKANSDSQYEHLFQVRHTDLEECCQITEEYDRLRRYYYRHHDLSMKNPSSLAFVHDSHTYTLLVSDEGIWIVPEVLATAKFLFSIPIELNDDSILTAIQKLRNRHEGLLQLQDKLFRSHMVPGGSNYRDPREIAETRLAIGSCTDKTAMRYLLNN